MAMEQRRLGTSQSETSINSRMSSNRRDKLMNLKKREDLKGALREKFTGRFGSGAEQRGDDEVSVSSMAIKREVDRFADRAAVTEANLGRLERRLHGRATQRTSDEQSVAGVSTYSGMSRNRSQPSMSSKLDGYKGKGATVAAGNFDWSKLDEYASYLHEQDAMRQKQGVVALQRKMRSDLEEQVAEKRSKKEQEEDEERRHHVNLMTELERWKETEQLRAEEMHNKITKEKGDRDEQLNFERRLKTDAENKTKKDESDLVSKIVNEMESDHTKHEKKKAEARKSMRKIFDDNNKEQAEKETAQKVQSERDAQAMRDYNRLLDEQDEQRADELGARMERQKMLMEKMQENVAAAAKESGDNDAMRANAQQEEMDRHAYEAEKAKQKRLKEMRLENKTYLFKQMNEKEGRGSDEKDLQNIQARMLQRDTAEYNELERQKAMQKRHQNFEHRQEIEQQIMSRADQAVPSMSAAETAMNGDLIHLVNRTLQAQQDDQYSQSGC